MTVVPRVKWMQDILPPAHKYHTFLKKVFRHELRKNWFKRITTPLLENKALFYSALWEATDVIDHQLYRLADPKGKNMILKPESTIPVMRSYLENELYEAAQPVFLYYVEPHFRFEKPKKWRLRQFFQVWAEIIGEADPILDAQLIFIWYKILNKLWLEWDFKIKINSLWTPKERIKYIEELRSFYENKKQYLSEEGLKKLESDPLRLFDTIHEDEKILAQSAPKMLQYLKKDSRQHYAKVKEYLDILEVPYEEDTTLVRSLDYYNHTVWEFVDTSGRTHESFWWGGRYDGLSQKIGYEESIPWVGFAFGMERLAQSLYEKGIILRDKDKIDLYFIQLGDEAKKVVLPLSLEAREAWINVLVSLWTPSLKIQMKKAMKLDARYVVMVGVMEANSWVYQVRDMLEWTQEEVNKEDLIAYITDKIGNNSLDFYCPAKDLIVKE